MKQFLVLLLILLPLSILHSQVTINVPGDCSTIQAGIDAASNGDIVLVAEGTYYENINFKGKAITVASHFLNVPNESYIENTIIDGSTSVDPDSGSVVYFVNGEDTTAVLCGFTITGGSGTYISGSDYRVGGGIMLWLSGAKICHNIITSNSIDNSTTYTRCYGGGILAYSQPSNLIISNNVISNNSIVNSSGVGGGISIYDNGPTWIISNKIINNVINCNGGSGGGIDIWNSNNELYVMNNIIRGNQVLSNNYGGGGIDIYNCTTNQPVIENNLIAENTGYLGGGILVDNPTEGDFKKMNSFNLNNHSLGENDRLDNSTLPVNIILLEAVIENNTIVNNTATSVYGGIYCRNASPEIRNSIVWGNNGPGPQIEGAGLVEYSNVEGGHVGTGNIDLNPEFFDTTYFLLSDISQCIDAGNPNLIYNDVEHIFNPGHPMPPANGTLTNDMGHCGGPNSLWCHWQWPFSIDQPSVPVLVGPTGPIDTTAVEFSWTQSQPFVTRYWFEIDTTNQFATSFVDSLITDTTYLYSDLEFGNDYWWRVRAFNAAGWGAFSDVGSIVIVSVEDDNQLPIEFSLGQNYPNPFNPVTTINYSIPKESDVNLIVYNMLGEEVAKLVNESQRIGNYEVELNAAELSSGVYFYKIQAGDFVQVRKMMLLK